MKIRPVAVEFFHADGRTNGHTDMKKLTVAFRNFMNKPKTCTAWSSTLQPPYWCKGPKYPLDRSGWQTAPTG
jgi:hypothetical protein